MNIVELTHATACAIDPAYEVDKDTLSKLKDKEQLNKIWTQTGFPWRQDGHKLVLEQKIPTGKQDEHGNDRLKTIRTIEVGISMVKITYGETSLLLSEGTKGAPFGVSGMTLPERDEYMDRLNTILEGQLYKKWDEYENSRPKQAEGQIQKAPRGRGKER